MGGHRAQIVMGKALIGIVGVVAVITLGHARRVDETLR
jgi:hypothetical protein